MYPFIQQIFTGPLLCAKHLEDCSRDVILAFVITKEQVLYIQQTSGGKFQIVKEVDVIP